MTKFVYVSNEYRLAWEHYVNYNIAQNDNALFVAETSGWEKFSNKFVEEFCFQKLEEVQLLEKYTRPKSWFLNDKHGEEQYLFNMSQKYYSEVKYQFTDGLSTFSDLCMERAIEMRDMGKEIDLFYSGGIDSVAMFLALREVCPKDQIHIIMGSNSSIEEYPKLYEESIKDFPHVTMGDGDLFGLARIDENLFTTGCEADMLYGADGYTLITIYAQADPNNHLGYHIDRSKAGNLSDPSNREWNDKRWYEKHRRLYLTQSWRFLRNLHVDHVDMNNYQPFFYHENFERHAINMHMNGEMVYYTPSPLEEHKKQYLKAKMMIRDFIYEKTIDRDYAYGAPKTITYPNVQKQLLSPLPPDYTVLAVTEDGTVVNRNNIMEFMGRDCLTI